jgi:hypothetical protein
MDGKPPLRLMWDFLIGRLHGWETPAPPYVGFSDWQAAWMGNPRSADAEHPLKGVEFLLITNIRY